MAIKKIGNIEVKFGEDVYWSDNRYGLDSVIINSITGQGWQLPLREINPDDLRELADMMDEALDGRSAESLKKEIIKICKQQHKQVFYTYIVKGSETSTAQYNFDYKNQVEDFNKLDLPECLLVDLLTKDFGIMDVFHSFADKATVTLHFV